jgi:hypothetical protein
MKKFLFIAAMALVATATFAQDAPVSTKKAKKSKKAKTTAIAPAVTTSIARPMPAAVSSTPAATPVKAAAPIAASTTDKTAKAGMKFETDVVDYGTIKQNSDRVRHFAFTNTGSEPLIIKNAQGSCGCTVPTYPKEPIMPGQKASIDVNYDTNRVGAFTKTVTLTTNAEGQETKVLTIKGVVEAAPGTTAPVAPAGH